MKGKEERGRERRRGEGDIGGRDFEGRERTKSGVNSPRNLDRTR